jgi:uncharacterized membrane protein (DUF2068 family)
MDGYVCMSYGYDFMNYGMFYSIMTMFVCLLHLWASFFSIMGICFYMPIWDIFSSEELLWKSGFLGNLVVMRI